MFQGEVLPPSHRGHATASAVRIEASNHANGASSGIVTRQRSRDQIDNHQRNQARPKQCTWNIGSGLCAKRTFCLLPLDQISSGQQRHKHNPGKKYLRLRGIFSAQRPTLNSSPASRRKTAATKPERHGLRSSSSERESLTRRRSRPRGGRSDVGRSKWFVTHATATALRPRCVEKKRCIGPFASQPSPRKSRGRASALRRSFLFHQLSQQTKAIAKSET